MMRLSAAISGERVTTVKDGPKAEKVEVKLEVDGGDLLFHVPSVNRASAVVFKVDREQLQQASTMLAAAGDAQTGEDAPKAEPPVRAVKDNPQA